MINLTSLMDKSVRRRDLLKILALGIFSGSITTEAVARLYRVPQSTIFTNPDGYIKDYLHKMKHFDDPHKDDIWISRDFYSTFKSTVKRLHRLEELVGHGNYQVLGFDDALKFGKRFSFVGEFPADELNFMEDIFYREASLYGFFGEKTMSGITDKINAQDVTFISAQGNHLFRGQPLETFDTILRQAGEEVVLTSGVRGIMKQFLLFLTKAYLNQGNLSLASRSLAPPGYSFHGSGDFDVGQAGFGALNFTSRFTKTGVFKNLCDLGYLKLRYDVDNTFGVRYEPWHIRIV